jgi:hypothetical protein
VRVDGDTAEADDVVTVSGGPIIEVQTATLTRNDDRLALLRAELL